MDELFGKMLIVRLIESDSRRELLQKATLFSPKVKDSMHESKIFKSKFRMHVMHAFVGFAPNGGYMVQGGCGMIFCMACMCKCVDGFESDLLNRK